VTNAKNTLRLTKFNITTPFRKNLAGSYQVNTPGAQSISARSTLLLTS